VIEQTSVDLSPAFDGSQLVPESVDRRTPEAVAAIAAPDESTASALTKMPTS
jgi:hypothetical protein